MKKFVFAFVLVIASAGMASAAPIPISIFTAPDQTFQNTTNNPCIFYGPGNCPHDPAGWLPPVGPTGQGNNQVIGPLTQTYAGADFTEFKNVIGGEFILGLDINQTDANSPQSMTDLTVTFKDMMGGILSTFALPSPTAVPDKANGNGFADYLLGVSCEPGHVIGEQCNLFNAFVLPTLASSVTFTYTMDPANDGSDTLFLIGAGASDRCPGCTVTPTSIAAVPEPTSLTLMGSGLMFLVGSARRRFRK